MKIWDAINKFPKQTHAVVTTGTFDGVHKGHQKILNRVKEAAKKSGGESVLLTFDPHPRMVLFPEDNDLQLITTLAERIDLLEFYGIDHLVILPFTKEFSRLSSLEFVRNILVNSLGTKKLIIGYNHHFGRNREGTFEHLQEFGPVYGFEVEEIPALDVDSVEVSSTKIRSALHQGDIENANKYLGHAFELRGIVRKGNQLGRSLGFPTANLEIPDPYKLIPANGVYFVTSTIQGKEYKGMMNIGIRPTVGGENRQIEVHLLGFEGDLYGQTLQVKFRKRMREERKFNGIEELKTQLTKDKETVLNLK